MSHTSCFLLSGFLDASYPAFPLVWPRCRCFERMVLNTKRQTRLKWPFLFDSFFFMSVRIQPETAIFWPQIKQGCEGAPWNPCAKRVSEESLKILVHWRWDILKAWRLDHRIERSGEVCLFPRNLRLGSQSHVLYCSSPHFLRQDLSETGAHQLSKARWSASSRGPSCLPLFLQHRRYHS